MNAKAKRTTGWILLVVLLLSVIFGIPYLAYTLRLEEAPIPWYQISFQVLAVLGGIAVLAGIVWGIIHLITSED